MTVSSTVAHLPPLCCPAAAHAAPLPDDPLQRRAIRGRPVESARESEALRALREFEEESFPRAAPLPDVGDEAPAPARQASLTGGLGPDALRPELRSPEPP